MLPTATAVTGQLAHGKVAHEGAEHDPAPYRWKDLPPTSFRKPTMEEIRGMRTYGPRKRGTVAQGERQTLAWNPTPQRLSGGTIVVEDRETTRGTVQEPPQVPPPGGGEENRQGEAPGAGAGGPPPPDGGSGGGGGGGGGSSCSDSDSDGDDDADGMDEDPKEEEQEDLSDGQAGKTYMPRTEGGKAMAKMQRKFCPLTKADTNAIVVYFGVYSENRLAEFQEAHWKDTFTQWQKRHTCPDSTKWVMALLLPQQDHI